MTELQTEAFNAVNKLNDKLFRKYKRRDDLDNLPVFSITFASDMVFIGLSPVDLPELQIFNSEDDDRQYNESKNKYESFEKFIVRKVKLIIDNLNTIKI